MTADRGEQSSLTIDTVVRQFGEADELLQAAARRLESIATHETNVEHAATALSQTAVVLQELSGRANDATGELRGALKLASQTLSDAARLLDGTAFGEVRRDLEALRSEVADLARSESSRHDAAISGIQEIKESSTAQAAVSDARRQTEVQSLSSQIRWSLLALSIVGVVQIATLVTLLIGR